MRRSNNQYLVVVSIWMIATGAFGAEPRTGPQPVSPERAAILQIESIALPPVLFPGDVTNETLTSEVFEEMTLALALKGYVLHRVGRIEPRSDPNPAPLSELSAEALASLLPEGGTHYLLCWIDYSMDGTVGISAVLIDRMAKSVLWRNSSSQGRILFQTDTPMGIYIAAQSANAPWVPPALRQSEFDRVLNQINESGQGLLDTLSPVVGAMRGLLSTFPEKPMR